MGEKRQIKLSTMNLSQERPRKYVRQNSDRGELFFYEQKIIINREPQNLLLVEKLRVYI